MSLQSKNLENQTKTQTSNQTPVEIKAEHRELQESLIRPPHVFRTLNVPKVFWEQHLVPFLKKWDQSFPEENFNVYRWIKIDKFVAEASDLFFVKLLTFCLKRAGIEINLVNNQQVVTITTAEDEKEYEKTITIIKLMSRFRDSDSSFIDRRKRVLDRYPKYCTAEEIKDVNPK